MRTVEFKGKSVRLIDQTELPHRLKFIECRSADEVAMAIEQMQIRGAPALGIVAAMALAVTAERSGVKNLAKLLKELEAAADRIRRTRPTAIDLFSALERVLKVARTARSVGELRESVEKEVEKMVDEDDSRNKRMGEFGAKLIGDGDTVLTHCNAGFLATAGSYGTALAAVRVAKEQGKEVRVIVTETRPLLQGARLTAWELKQDGIPVTLITDNMIGYCFSKKLVNLVMVGADRILSDGHITNKIGTFTIAMAAKHHSIPFYVVAPLSTFDLKSRVEDVVIEERDLDEVRKIRGVEIAPKEIPVLNPAFDITPPELVTSIITEKGVIQPPFEKNILKFAKD
jgi:methylthioribose-1-phosphate isomerase